MLATCLLAGCVSQTSRPSAVGAGAATLHGALSCHANFDGRWSWQWRELGTTAWSTGGPFQLNCPHPSVSPSFRVATLKPDTSYQYRLFVDIGWSAWIDADGTINGSHWNTVTTQPRCNDAQGQTESLAGFLRSNSPGTPTARRVLCLRAGHQDIGQVNGIPAWTTLTPHGEPDGTKQIAVLDGNIGLDNRGAALEDVKVVGCYYQPGCRTSRDKAIDVTANDTALMHVEVTQRGGRNADRIQCVHIASETTQLTGVRMEFSKAHSCGSESANNHYHGLYCRDAISPRIIGNWFYDNEGFGVQMWPNCDGAQAVGNVVAANGGACDVSGAGPGRTSSGSIYRNGFCGLARENTPGGDFPPVHCYESGANQIADLVAFDSHDPHRVTDCLSSQLRASGTLNLDPQFVDASAYDFRMRNPYARAKLGIYAEIVPGPRW
jgi:hypothetical protein